MNTFPLLRLSPIPEKKGEENTILKNVCSSYLLRTERSKVNTNTHSTRMLFQLVANRSPPATIPPRTLRCQFARLEFLTASFPGAAAIGSIKRKLSGARTALQFAVTPTAEHYPVGKGLARRLAQRDIQQPGDTTSLRSTSARLQSLRVSAALGA